MTDSAHGDDSDGDSDSSSHSPSSPLTGTDVDNIDVGSPSNLSLSPQNLSPFSDFHRSPASSESISANEGSYIFDEDAMQAIRKFSTSTAMSIDALKTEAKRLGLVITMGSRIRDQVDKRIGFGLKKKLRRHVDLPTTLLRFNTRVDGMLYPGTKCQYVPESYLRKCFRKFIYLHHAHTNR